eukprot:13132074-Heterocapsa_arctica.AAC.1
MDSVDMKFTTKLDTFDKKFTAQLKTQDKKIATTLKAQDKKIENLGDSVKESLKKMDDRIHLMEKKPAAPANVPLAARSSSTPHEDRVPPHPHPGPASRSFVPFVPKLVHVQGWGAFGSGVGLTQDEGKEL